MYFITFGGNYLARRDVRARVLSAAKSVFSQGGYRAATVADILAEAGIARATFYKYFRNKRQVFVDLIHDFLETIYENTGKFLAKELEESEQLADRAKEALIIFYGFFLENRDIIRVYYREAFGFDPGLYAIWDDFDRRMISLLSKILAQGVKRGTFREMDTEPVARALLMIFLQVPYRDIMAPGRADIDIESLAGEMARFALEGVLARDEGWKTAEGSGGGTHEKSQA